MNTLCEIKPYPRAAEPRDGGRGEEDRARPLHPDHYTHCKTASGTNWSNRWNHRVFVIDTRRD